MKTSMTIYDYAKQVISSEVPMDIIAANRKFNEMAKYIKNSKYTMLLCRERNDYTIFNNSYSSSEDIGFAAKELGECIHNRGLFLVADKQPDGAYEIWIRDPKTEENFCYYLFQSNKMVVEV